VARLSSQQSSGNDPVAVAPTVAAAEIFRRFWPYVRPDWHWLPVSVALLLTGSATEIASIWLFKDLVDEVLVPHHFSKFLPLALIMVLLASAGALATYVGNYTAAWVGERLLERLRTAATAHLHTLPPDELERRWHGDLLARLTTDIFDIEQVAASGLVQAASALISLLFFAAAAVYLSWPLALAALCTAPLFLIAARFFGSHIQRRSREALRRDGSVTAVVEESLANASLADAYNQQEHEVDRVRTESTGLLRAELATARFSLLYPRLLSVIEVVCGLIVIGVGAYELTRGQITIGGLLAFAAFLAELFAPAHELSALAATFGSASAAAERVIELLRMRTPVQQRPGARDLVGVRGRLEGKHIGAEYNGRSVLREINFSVAPGEILAVMGPSGTGKSTLAKLLVRFMDPSTGAVLLDGTDLQDATITSVRQSVTLLPQQSRLFRATIRDNIAYGRPEAAGDEIVQAARDADAHEFITALPDGYQTIVGKDGFQLSGGQRQRIAIARAFLRATPVLVLDEPTAGLDTESVGRLIPPLRRLMTGRTTILISHDWALAQQADSIYTLPGLVPEDPGPSTGPEWEEWEDPKQRAAS
jgi:ABC-type multidrug transport system fused ATPase/permease subunit